MSQRKTQRRSLSAATETEIHSLQTSDDNNYQNNSKRVKRERNRVAAQKSRKKEENDIIRFRNESAQTRVFETMVSREKTNALLMTMAKHGVEPPPNFFDFPSKPPNYNSTLATTLQTFFDSNGSTPDMPSQSQSPSQTHLQSSDSSHNKSEMSIPNMPSLPSYSHSSPQSQPSTAMPTVTVTTTQRPKVTKVSTQNVTQPQTIGIVSPPQKRRRLNTITMDAPTHNGNATDTATKVATKVVSIHMPTTNVVSTTQTQSQTQSHTPSQNMASSELSEFPLRIPQFITYPQPPQPLNSNNNTTLPIPMPMPTATNNHSLPPIHQSHNTPTNTTIMGASSASQTRNENTEWNQLNFSRSNPALNSNTSNTTSVITPNPNYPFSGNMDWFGL